MEFTLSDAVMYQDDNMLYKEAHVLLLNQLMQLQTEKHVFYVMTGCALCNERK